MNVVWNTCKRELSKTATKSLFENFQSQLFKKFRKRQYIVYGFITMLSPVPICDEMKS